MCVPRTLLALCTSAVIAVVTSGQSWAQVAAGTESLGDVRFEVSCAESARARFDRAVALLHHMTYPRARAEFSAIAADHPACAMAHWGIAMTLFQPLWPTRPSAEDLRRGWQEVSTARKIGTPSSREKLFIAAAAAFFDPSHADYWQRINSWAEATRALYEAHPRDPEASAFFVLAQLATAPPSGEMTHHTTAAAVLADILRDRPGHPGAVHYTIHANDAPGRQSEALDVVRRYDEIAPRNAHALHMPTHIFVRLGDWLGVVEGNRRAAEAALENPAGDRQQWVWDEYPHAIEYLVYALLQMGDDDAARAAVDRLQQTADLQPGFKTAFHLSSIPARFALERHDWKMAAQLEPRPHPGLAWDELPWPEAVTWFARGIGAVRTGNITEARTAESRIADLTRTAQRLGEDLWARQSEILRLGVKAWIAFAAGDRDNAVRLMQLAVTLEANTPKHAVTPAPTLPAAELLGDLFLDLDRPADALSAYQASLRSTPARFNSLLGAARAARRAGNTALAVTFYRTLRDQSVAASPRPELDEAAAFLRRPSGSPRNP